MLAKSMLGRSTVGFHVESQEYACTDPVLRTVETRCFKTCLTILRPPANGLYRCHIRLLHLSESASWSFRPVYLIPGQETLVSVMHVPEKTTGSAGFLEREASFEALGHEFDYETTTDSQSDSTVMPSESWPNGYSTEVSETYDGVSRPSGSSSLEVQPTVTWKVDPPPSSVDITTEPGLIMTVTYMQNVSGICLANISCLCSGVSSPTKLVIYALDPANEGQPSTEASPTELELSRMLPVAESLNASHVSTLQTVKDGRLVHCASDCGVNYERLTAGDCNHAWPQTPDHAAPNVWLPPTKISSKDQNSQRTLSKPTTLPLDLLQEEQANIKVRE
nr:unnamed protein product [Spirometra erinaceieuropaei]